MSSLRVYYNLACSKCRELRGLLEERGERFELVEYLRTPPSLEELLEVVRKVGGVARPPEKVLALLPPR